MDSKKYLCNNCGNYGHLFYNCKKPITSFGILCYRRNLKNVIEYLLVQRKDTLGYVDFLRGKFSETNNFQLINIISEMTQEEKTNIQTKTYKELWCKLWNNVLESYEIKNEEKFNYIKKNKPYLFTTESPWKEPEWGFPKGRRNYKEKDLECALREFSEETGYDKSDITLLKNLNSFEEIFTGSNLKSYKHKYFLASIPYFTSLDDCNYQKCEIGNMKWFSFENAIKQIRDYNIEKIELLTDINKLLEENTIF
jgi:8-oxo-dGTP pyrophosphatase MutT (NUDIX family)